MKHTPFAFYKPADRPFFFTSFVSTIDGKIIVKDKGYWPIGSKTDYEYFTWLRAHADAIVDAKNTALQFGKYTIRTIHEEMFRSYQRELGITETPELIVLTSNPDEALAKKLQNDHGYKTTILTVNGMDIEKTVSENFNIVQCHPEVQPKDPDIEFPACRQAGSRTLRMTNKRVEVQDLIYYLNFKRHKHVFIDGGPTLIAQLLQAGVLDEIHLTIAPKVFGSAPGKTLTMAEGILFPPESVPQFKLLSVENLGDEVVLRYGK